MIKIPQGFKIASKEVVDTRLVMSKAEMLTVSDAVMPEVYFTLCSDDNTMYIYNKQNTLLCSQYLIMYSGKMTLKQLPEIC